MDEKNDAVYYKLQINRFLSARRALRELKISLRAKMYWRHVESYDKSRIDRLKAVLDDSNRVLSREVVLREGSSLSNIKISNDYIFLCCAKPLFSVVLREESSRTQKSIDLQFVVFGVLSTSSPFFLLMWMRCDAC